MSGLVRACPECDSSQTKARKKKRPRYRCWECKSEFDHPNYRPRRPRGVAISKADVVEDIQKLADRLGRTPTAADYSEFARYSLQTVNNRFGSWNEALEAAGFTPRQQHGKMVNVLQQLNPEDLGLSPIGERA